MRKLSFELIDTTWTVMFVLEIYFYFLPNMNVLRLHQKECRLDLCLKKLDPISEVYLVSNLSRLNYFGEIVIFMVDVR